VNVAARLEELADPGGICVSARVQEDVRGKLDVTLKDEGEQQLKNIAWPVRIAGCIWVVKQQRRTRSYRFRTSLQLPSCRSPT
jgi:class 3 adenylate cyclase